MLNTSMLLKTLLKFYQSRKRYSNQQRTLTRQTLREYMLTSQLIELVFTPLTCFCLSALVVSIHDFHLLFLFCNFYVRDNFRSQIYPKILYFPTLFTGKPFDGQVALSTHARDRLSLECIAQAPEGDLRQNAKRSATVRMHIGAAQNSHESLCDRSRAQAEPGTHLWR